MRTFWLTMATLPAVLFIFAGAVQAQVAAPRLNTTIAASQSVFNPADKAVYTGLSCMDAPSRGYRNAP